MKRIKTYHWFCILLLVAGLTFWGCAKKEAEPIKIGGIFDITGPTSAEARITPRRARMPNDISTKTEASTAARFSLLPMTMPTRFPKQSTFISSTRMWTKFL